MSRALSSMEDRPFGCPPDAAPQPIVTVIDLPFPPSTNSIWSRTRKGMRSSDAYKTWKQAADKFVLYTGSWRRAKKIRGPFLAEIVFDRSERNRSADLDNRVKAVLDWCQSRELIQNDKYLEGLGVVWGVAPHGARVTLREVLT